MKNLFLVKKKTKIHRDFGLIFVAGILRNLKLADLVQLLQTSRKKTHSNQNRVAIEVEVDREKEEAKKPTQARFV